MATVLSDKRKAFADQIAKEISLSIGSNKIWSRDACAFWCASILESVTGNDPAKEFRNRYSDDNDLKNQISNFDLARVIFGTIRSMGWPRIKVRDALVGDIGIISSVNGPSAVIRDATGYWVTRVQNGFQTWPDKFVSRAYRVCD